MRKISLIIAFVLVSFVSISAQTFDGKEINRDLEWSDFVGAVDKSSKFDAFTVWRISYNYPSPKFNGDKAQVTVTVRLFLHSSSWVRPNKKTDRLLNHERGHYRIGMICANEIEDTINSTDFDRDNYKTQIEELYREIIKEYADFEKQYDKETEHYNNQEQQDLWDEKLDELLNQ